VGPRFVETTLTYESFDGTHYILESFSCKLVVMYRVNRWRGNIAVTHVANASRRVWGKSTFCLQIGRDVPHHDDRNGIDRCSSLLRR
jgi:hypothetical protein